MKAYHSSLLYQSSSRNGYRGKHILSGLSKLHCWLLTFTHTYTHFDTLRYIIYSVEHVSLRHAQTQAHRKSESATLTSDEDKGKESNIKRNRKKRSGSVRRI